MSEPKRRRVDDSPSTCVLCAKPLDPKDKTVVKSPDLSKLDKLFESAEVWKDEAAHILLSNKESIISGDFKIKYHRHCRFKYTSNVHLERTRKAQETEEQPSVQETPSTSTRSKIQKFEWKKFCFICGKLCAEKKPHEWSMVETATNVHQENSIYYKVLKAAKERNDTIMLDRLQGVPNADLVAVDARYHRKKKCLLNYTNPRNIRARLQTEKDSVFKDSLESTMDEFIPSMEDEQQIYLLTAIKARFCEILESTGVENLYTSQKLKAQIQKFYPGITFLSQAGKSDIVCSSNTPVSVVVKQASKLNKTESSEDSSDSEDLLFCQESNSEILHKAASILRQEILETPRLQGEYYSANEMTRESLLRFVNKDLLSFIGWLINKKHYESATHIEDQDLVALSISSDIIAAATGIHSPKHLGLAIHLHKEFGARKLVELMFQHGYSISYPELRRFHTSVSVHVTQNQQVTESGALVPTGFKKKEDGGRPPKSASDNWDHLERTVDGKQTTHAMTSLVAAPGTDAETGAMVDLPRIARYSAPNLLDADLSTVSLTMRQEYKKPNKRPEPILRTPIKLEEFKANSESREVRKCQASELVYHLGRSTTGSELSGFPHWKQFRALIHSDSQPVTVISFNPILMAIPTEFSTVYTSLRRAKETAVALGFDHTVVFFDMGLLTKALEIVWARPEEFSSVIPLAGGMHLLMSYIASIGKLFGDAGLKSLLHESGVFAAGTVNNMLAGKDFDRALYGLYLLDEVFHQIFIQSFLKWCDAKGRHLSHDIMHLLGQISNKFENNSSPKEEVESACAIVETEVTALVAMFQAEGRNSSAMFTFWDDFLQKVIVPFKLFMVATRSANWELYKECQKLMLPLFFSADRKNYSRYMTAQISMMDNLPDDIEEDFKQGFFTMKLTPGAFKSVWFDYGLETTENKDLKTTGGIIGITRQGEVLKKWFLARPLNSVYSRTYMDNMVQSAKSEKDTSPTTEKRWTADVVKLANMFKTSYIDPFIIEGAPDGLVNFATGAKAPAPITTSLLQSFDRGATLVEQFVSNRLIAKKSFYDAGTSSNVQTMALMSKKVTVKSKNITVDSETMYMRLMTMNSYKKMPIARVMAYENAAVPLSLYAGDGTMLNCKKSDFMAKLEESLGQEETIHDITSADTVIFDGHYLIQTLMLPEHCEMLTFKDVCKLFVKKVMYISNPIGASHCNIHIVFDHYEENSTKSHTREKRTGQVGHMHHIQPGGNIPKNWKTFLANTENKESLARCIADYIKEEGSAFINNKQFLWVGGGTNFKSFKVCKTQVFMTPQLDSTQEEADTRLILHLYDSGKSGIKRAVVCSPDTDVLVLLVHHRSSINCQEIYLMTGKEGKHTTLTRFIPVHDICTCLPQEQLNILISVYCLTGCDTVCSFHGKGKKTAFKIMQKHASTLQGLQDLGEEPVLTDTQLKQGIRFVGMLYGNENTTSLNVLRANKAKGKVGPRKLPPTDDSVKCHFLKAVLQLYIWRKALVPKPLELDPTDYAWERDPQSNQLSPVMMLLPAAAPELLNDIICECSDLCEENCKCAKFSQSCTAACSCKPFEERDDGEECRNPNQLVEINQSSDEEEGQDNQEEVEDED